MNLAMIGLDYQSASIELREQISLTKEASIEAMHRVSTEYGYGMVVLSTCNRTELYFASPSPLSEQWLLETYEGFVGCEAPYYLKRDHELIQYLFELTCGLHSMILGEDQIITQVGDAMQTSMTEGTGNPIINTLFRHAVTCAKRAKSGVNIKHISPSIVSQAIAVLQKTQGDLAGKKALVIGNGEMGRLSATLLVEQGVEVFMTLRSYKYHVVEVPKGCQTIYYENREVLLPEVDFVLSATKSPHYTITKEMLAGLEHLPNYLFDLALPRDIEPEVTELDGVICLDVDAIGKEKSPYDEGAIEEIRHIIEEQKVKYYEWLYYHKRSREKAEKK